jgi:hypothetical protein
LTRSQKVTSSEKVTRSFFCFRWRSAKCHADKTRGRKVEDPDKNQSRDNTDGHSRLELRTIATAGQGFMILVCGNAV